MPWQLMHWSLPLELLVRSAVLLLAGEMIRSFSKRQSAAFRHLLLLWVFASLALLPLLSVLLPEIPIGLWRNVDAARALVTVQELPPTALRTPVRHPFNWLFVIWLTGVVLTAAPLAMGALWAWRINRRATPLTTPAFREALLKLSGLTSNQVEILISRECLVPLTCGLVGPRILLPAIAEQWDCSRLQAVLLHELAHVRRRDVAAQVAAHIVAALWWFQPLVWILRKELRAESELACDAEALQSGFRPSDYAAELLAVAKTIGRASKLSSPFISNAISMARSGDLEARVGAILHPPATLVPPKKFALVLILGSIAVTASAVTVRRNQALNEQGGSIMKSTILSALLTSVGLSAATVSGSIHDSSGAAVPDVKVMIYNPDTGTKQDTITADDGKFSFDGTSAGQYILRIEKPGFASIFREFDLKADSTMEREFTMANEGGEQVADKIVNTNEDPSKRLRIGGRVAQSNLLVKVQPAYPLAAKRGHTQGTVELETTISKDGVPLEIRVVSSPSDDLSQSSLEAVRQWHYRPTLLNGQPVEIVTDVIVNYTLIQ